jgi:serine O-acetyltransferase
MRWSLAPEELAAYTARQLALFSLPSGGPAPPPLKPFLRETLARVEKCFNGIRRKYFFDGKRAIFNHLHGDHYAMYLYLLSNTIYRSGRDEQLAQQVFLLNKALHGADLFCAINLPEIFLLVHPVGTVLGNAIYGNYFVAYQNCAVGSLEDGGYPVFAGENVLFSRSAVIGPCRVGRNVVFGANAFLLNSEIPRNSTVVGAYPQHRILPCETRVLERMFR